MIDLQTLSECYFLAREVEERWMREALDQARNIVKERMMNFIEITRELEIDNGFGKKCVEDKNPSFPKPNKRS